MLTLSDLHRTKIDRAEVRCEHSDCAKEFSFSGDLVNPAFQMILFDCRDLFAGKHFSNCILNAAQSYEMFFNLFLKLELVFKPFERQEVVLEELNRILALLYQVQSDERLTFPALRRIFVHLAVNSVQPGSLAEAEPIVRGLRKIAKDRKSFELIHTISDERLRTLAAALAATDIWEMRNKVIHLHAYRPTAEEARVAVSEAERILHGLKGCLKMEEPIGL